MSLTAPEVRQVPGLVRLSDGEAIPASCAERLYYVRVKLEDIVDGRKRMYTSYVNGDGLLTSVKSDAQVLGLCGAEMVKGRIMQTSSKTFQNGRVIAIEIVEVMP